MLPAWGAVERPGGDTCTGKGLSEAVEVTITAEDDPGRSSSNRKGRAAARVHPAEVPGNLGTRVWRHCCSYGAVPQ